VGDIAELRIKHVKEVLEDPSKEFHAFEITPIKNLRKDDPLPANPVMGSDSCNYLRRWIDYAQSKYGKHMELEDEAYVYFKVKSGRARTFPDGSDYSAYAMFEPLDNKGISGLFANIKRKNKDKFRKEISAHSFRKTHMTRLQAGGVPERWINIMHGRAGQGTQGIYSKPDYEMLTKSYVEAYSYLSFNVSAQAFDKVMEDQENIKSQMDEMANMIKDLQRHSVWIQSGSKFIMEHSISDEARVREMASLHNTSNQIRNEILWDEFGKEIGVVIDPIEYFEFIGQPERLVKGEKGKTWRVMKEWFTYISSTNPEFAMNKEYGPEYHLDRIFTKTKEKHAIAMQDESTFTMGYEIR
jgi:hypothetical protein